MNIFNLEEQPEYINTLAEWHHSEWSYLNPGQSLTDRLEKMYPCLNDGFLPSTYIFKQGDHLAGSAAIVLNDMDTHSELTPWLASVYVSPGFRNKGIGSKLVLHVMEQAKMNGFKTLYLFTPTKTQFYRNLGWSEIGEEVYRGDRVTIMSIHFS